MMSDYKFWQALDSLRIKLVQEERVVQLSQTCMTDPLGGQQAESPHTMKAAATPSSSADVIKLIEDKIVMLLTSLAQGEAPALSYDSRTTWDNVRFREGLGLEQQPDVCCTQVKFDSIMSVNRFALTIKVLSWIHRLLQTSTYATKRDLYYKDPAVFGNQSSLDDIVNNISCMLRVPRWQLHVGVLVPSRVDAISSLQSEAKFVLIVEKDATFQALLDAGLQKRLAPCILITGKGFPDVNTRLMVRRLWDSFHVPILALVDDDPHGIEIMCIYKFGSRSLSFEAPRLTVPAVLWLGLLPSDIDKLQLPEEALLPLTRSDHDKLGELQQRPYFSSQPAWMHQVDWMLKRGVKAEIQSLTCLSHTFLTDVYLPNKLQFAGWI